MGELCLVCESAEGEYGTNGATPSSFSTKGIITYSSSVEGLVLAVRELYYQASEGFQCTVCQHNSKSRQNMENHVEAKHVTTGGWPCHLCSRVCPSKNAYNVHFSRNHKQKLM